MVEFLNNEIRPHKDMGPETASQMERSFKDAIDLAFSIWGPEAAFRK